MTFETAQAILKQEFAEYAQTAQPQFRLAIELFGGEPLTNFPLIKSIYEWVKEVHPPFNYLFQITTNGTLLTDDIKQWLVERKENFRLVMSVDGTEAMQKQNRGCDIAKLPISFVKETWPQAYFKLTLSSETLPHYAEGVISLYEQGYRIASSLAEGQTWGKYDAEIYRQELQKIADYFMTHPDKQPEHPFNFLFMEYLEPRIHHKVPHKNCGAGTTIAMYDTDGTLYPCHLFLPMVHGQKEVKNDIKGVDWSDPQQLIDETCSICPAIKICKTCYGYNYAQRGSISKRDKGMCHLRLVEALTISQFQINYFTQKQDLSKEDLISLKAAVACYKHLSQLHVNEKGIIEKRRV